jgi:hypothetical protein
VAGCFQDYWKFEGVYGKRKGGWFKDMFAPGFEGEELPAEERWRALQWQFLAFETGRGIAGGGTLESLAMAR